MSNDMGSLVDNMEAGRGFSYVARKRLLAEARKIMGGDPDVGFPLFFRYALIMGEAKRGREEGVRRVIKQIKERTSGENFWFNWVHMQRIADQFGISGAFLCIEGYHWALALQPLENGRLKIYDPREADGRGSHIHDIKVLNNSMIMISKPLVEVYDLPTPGNYWTPGTVGPNNEELLEALVQNDYNLNLPDRFRDRRLQAKGDTDNCGPLSLYACLCSDVRTPQFSERASVGAREVRQAGITDKL